MSMLKYICKSRQIPENHYQIRLLKTGVLAYVLAYGCFRQSFRQSGFVRESFCQSSLYMLFAAWQPCQYKWLENSYMILHIR